MPYLPLHKCNYPGCSVFTSERYCEKHKHQKHVYDKQRGSAQERGYTRRWQIVSKLFLKEHPLCECDECQRHHKLTSANVVHHIIPHHGNQELFWDETNWMAMNKKCHDKHTWTETRGKKQGDGV